MPLLYAVDGSSSPYIAPPVSPVGGAFATVLSREMNQMGFPDLGGSAPRSREKKSARGYGESPSVHLRKPVLTAGDVMTSPAECISPDASLHEAHELMLQKRFRHLPVISREGKLMGILSDRDILRSGLDQTITASRHMTEKVLTATAETPIRQIAEALLLNRIGALPIIDPNHKILGIITTTDILKAIVNRAPLELWA